MTGKFRETVIHQVEPKEKAEPKTSEEKNEEIAGADMAPALSQDAINALAEAARKARNRPGLAIGKARGGVLIFRAILFGLKFNHKAEYEHR